MPDVESSARQGAPLPVGALYRPCDPDQFSFETTRDLSTGTLVVGQERAAEAVRFGVGMRQHGYNLFAIGPAGTGRRAFVRRFLERKAEAGASPADICYVNDFDEAKCPRLLLLPAGRGGALRHDMEQFVEDLRTALPAAFEAEEYQLRRQVVQEEVQEEQEHALEDLQQRARQDDVALLRTPQGFTFAPVREGEILSPEQFQGLEEEERGRIRTTIEAFQNQLQEILRQVPQRQREMRERIRELNQEVAAYVVGDSINALLERYADLDDVQAFLRNVRDDIVDNVGRFIDSQQEGNTPAAQVQTQMQGAQGLGSPFRRYRVNVLVDHSEASGAPIVYEDNPTYQNLVGRIEQFAMMGALVTDFNLIKAGALHRAHGGYLIVEARKLLTQPFAWEGLKRALLSGELRIESAQEALGFISTVTLEPEPLPLDVKVVLVGERWIYYLLQGLDPDVGELFKVMVDFDEQTDRDADAQQQYAELVAHAAETKELRPFDRTGVARIVEHAARLAQDAERLSTNLQQLTDLACEADYWADEAQADTVTAAHVQQALDAQVRRADRVRERIQEQIEREHLFISTDGAQVGQINGLAVLQLGGFMFGRPNRITVRVRLGRGEITDIERETALGGPLHSKGVLILSGFLNGRYAQDRPLSLSATLVFEQSYGGVDGDSASAAELFALLSAISDVPIQQRFALTGSINQHGQIQPIGGVNEKIEGFFDVCRRRGLTGDQGVIIPQANADQLMLRRDVVEAARQGQFAVYAIETVDEGIALLTGLPAGTRGDDGSYPEDSFNARVEARLAEFAARRKEFIATNGQPEARGDAP